MKIKIIFEQDSESTHTNRQDLNKKIAGWLQNFSFPSPKHDLTEQKRTIVLEFTGDDIITAVRDLHEQLYESHVNFTITFL